MSMPAGKFWTRSARQSGPPPESSARPRGGLIVSAPIVFGRLHVLPVITEFLNTIGTSMYG